MFRAAPRLIARPVARAAPLRTLAPARRYLSTAPPTQKSRSWKSLFARFGIASGIIYYYNTTDIFAEEPRYVVQSLPVAEAENEQLPTIESISEERKKRQAVQAQLDAQKQEAASKQQNAKAAGGAEGGIGGLEAEADQQGAFNPETGEINWDCPCLGGMASGPCGEEFKAAFSCFVYSEEEPKGMDCIDKFKGMQDCFRLYPEIYGSEIDQDDEGDDDIAADLATPESAPESSSSSPSSLAASDASSDVQSAPPSSQSSASGKASREQPTLQPHSPQKVEDNRRELGLVPGNYQPDRATDARTDDASKTERKVKQQTSSQQPSSS